MGCDCPCGRTGTFCLVRPNGVHTPGAVSRGPGGSVFDYPCPPRPAPGYDSANADATGARQTCRKAAIGSQGRGPAWPTSTRPQALSARNVGPQRGRHEDARRAERCVFLGASMKATWQLTPAASRLTPDSRMATRGGLERDEPRHGPCGHGAVGGMAVMVPPVGVLVLGGGQTGGPNIEHGGCSHCCSQARCQWAGRLLAVPIRMGAGHGSSAMVSPESLWSRVGPTGGSVKMVWCDSQILGVPSPRGQLDARFGMPGLHGSWCRYP